jgi:uncharacterized protein (TIGR04168 family)
MLANVTDQNPEISTDEAFRLAIIGDLHTHWDQVDLIQFDRAGYDLLYFVGDLGGGTPDSTTRVARSISQLKQPALVMPGNNDTWDINELAAELAHQNGLNQLLSITRAEEESYCPIELCGYSQHTINANGRKLSLIAARPHSMGGPELSFPDYMSETYQIQSLEQSTECLIQLVDESVADELIFLAHNGPLGHGESPEDMWGCDFKEGGGDWGDPDLSRAIEHALAIGNRVLAVIGGHMHLVTKQGIERPWKNERDGTIFINAARVPRIFSKSSNVFRHHVLMTIDSDAIKVEEIFLSE